LEIDLNGDDKENETFAHLSSKKINRTKVAKTVEEIGIIFTE